MNKKIIPSSLARDFKKEIDEKSRQILSFNVMPDRRVEEILTTKKYIVKNRYVEVLFDREYISEMLNSPSHLIFLSSQIQLQKLLYVYLCHEFGLPYQPGDKELIKIWPTRVDVSIPNLIRNTKSIKQNVDIHELSSESEGTYNIKCTTNVNDSMKIYGEAMILWLSKRN